MPAAISITLFGGPADGRTMAAPSDADYLDYHVRIGKPLFTNGTMATITHRYWIERSTSGTHGIGLHTGAVTGRKISSAADSADEGPAVEAH